MKLWNCENSRNNKNTDIVCGLVSLSKNTRQSYSKRNWLLVLRHGFYRNGQEKTPCWCFILILARKDKNRNLIFPNHQNFSPLWHCNKPLACSPVKTETWRGFGSIPIWLGTNPSETVASISRTLRWQMGITITFPHQSHESLWPRVGIELTGTLLLDAKY